MDLLWAYSNGSWIRSDELCVSVDDTGFLMGATVTERLRTFGGLPFRLDEHLRRLRRSLEIVGLHADEITAEVAVAVPDFLRRNREQIADDDDWTIITFATPGVAGSGRPTVCVHGYPLQFHLWATLYETGVPVVVSDTRQVPPNSWPPELKCRSRMHYYLADRQAAAQRAGARAILLDQNGFVAEASTANVLVHQHGEGLVSPPRDHILSGVSLSVIQELAAKLGVRFAMRPLAVDELRTASEAMLTSTSACLLPIVECDSRSIGDGVPGPMYRRLLAAWNDLVGLDVAGQARHYAERVR